MTTVIARATPGLTMEVVTAATSSCKKVKLHEEYVRLGERTEWDESITSKMVIPKVRCNIWIMTIIYYKISS